MSRRRRATLRGWSRYLPFVLIPFGLLFYEVWLQTQILNNEYRKNALRSTIKQRGATIDELRDEVRELARMERVLERAPDLGLVPPEPGQVIEIQLAEGTPDTKPIPVAAPAAPPPRRQRPLAAIRPVPGETDPAPRPRRVLFDPLEPVEPALEGSE